MKSSISLLLLCGLLNTAFAGSGRDSGGGTPFIASGSMIQAIFQDQDIWRKISGSVDQITVNSRVENGTQYKVQTHEPVLIKNADGVVIGGTQQLCTFLVTVTYTDIAPQVTNIDFSGCPTVTSSQP